MNSCGGDGKVRLARVLPALFSDEPQQIITVVCGGGNELLSHHPQRPIIAQLVPRRLHVPSLADLDTDPAGKLALPSDQAHHARKVLRLSDGDTVELFDDAGRVATGILRMAGRAGRWEAWAEVRSVANPPEGVVAGSPGGRLVVASAIPKGDRADWMVEKLSELGVAAWIPLITARGVVVPPGGERSGGNKAQRWRRLAVESAKQSRRTGVMVVGEAKPLAAALSGPDAGAMRVVLEPGAPTPLAGLAQRAHGHAVTTLLIGPEGGWAPDELVMLAEAGVRQARLTSGTVLRIETAAVAAAAVWLCGGPPSEAQAHAHPGES